MHDTSSCHSYPHAGSSRAHHKAAAGSCWRRVRHNWLESQRAGNRDFFDQPDLLSCLERRGDRSGAPHRLRRHFRWHEGSSRYGQSALRNACKRMQMPAQ